MLNDAVNVAFAGFTARKDASKEVIISRSIMHIARVVAYVQRSAPRELLSW
jgi:hypothetical protein